jgi:hypothetical protein
VIAPTECTKSGHQGLDCTKEVQLPCCANKTKSPKALVFGYITTLAQCMLVTSP